LLSLNCMVRAFSTVLWLLCYVCDWYQGS
jgi:hypothetical protein